MRLGVGFAPHPTTVNASLHTHAPTPLRYSKVRRAKSIRSKISMGNALSNVNKQMGVDEDEDDENRKPTTLRRGMSRKVGTGTLNSKILQTNTRASHRHRP